MVLAETFSSTKISISIQFHIILYREWPKFITQIWYRSYFWLLQNKLTWFEVTTPTYFVPAVNYDFKLFITLILSMVVNVLKCHNKKAN